MMDDDGDDVDGDDVDDNGGVERRVFWWFWSIALVPRLVVVGCGGVAGIGSGVDADADIATVSRMSFSFGFLV